MKKRTGLIIIVFLVVLVFSAYKKLSFLEVNYFSYINIIVPFLILVLCIASFISLKKREYKKKNKENDNSDISN